MTTPRVNGFSLIELTFSLALLAAAAATGEELLLSSRAQPARPDEDVAIQLATILSTSRKDAVQDAERVRVSLRSFPDPGTGDVETAQQGPGWSIDRSPLDEDAGHAVWRRLDEGAFGDGSVEIKGDRQEEVVHFDDTGAIARNDAHRFVVTDRRTGQSSQVEIFASGKVCVKARAMGPLQHAGIAACSLA